MAAVIVNGVFSSGTLTINAVPNQAVTGTLVFANTSTSPFTVNSAALSGANANKFTIPAGQFPVTVNPGQSVIIQVQLLGSANGTYNAQITLSTSVSGFSPFASLTGLVAASANFDFPDPFPTIITYQGTKLGTNLDFAQMQIVNGSANSITVSAIGLTTGTDFSIIGAPATPFVIAQGAASAVFTVRFTPTVVGYRLDFLNATTSGGHGQTLTATLQGSGSPLLSAFTLTGATQGTLFAFPGASAPLILLASPTNFNTEEPGSFVKLHDFSMINVEKQLMRVRGHYEDLGVATITVKARCRRLGQNDEIISVNVNIGTVAADGWIREFTSEPTPVSGELVQLTISRAANSGPVSIIDYVPEFEPKGEVIGGT